MDNLIHQISSGVAMGMIYGGIALAFVMVYQTTHHLNFAQGEMATLTTFIAWALLEQGLNYWLVLIITIAAGFVLGAFIEWAVMRRLEPGADLSTVIVTVGLLILLNSLGGLLFGYTSRSFPSPFESLLPSTGLFSAHELGMCIVVLAMVLALYGLLRFTRLGLAIRGAVSNASSASKVGVSVPAMRSMGWGLAGAIAAVIGMMAAPVVFLEPNMMMGIIVYGFAAALLGGLTNPWGAVLGGILVGVLENLAGTYVIGNDLKLTVALAAVVGVLLFKPSGLLSRRAVRRL